MHAPLETFRIVDGSDVYCKTSTNQFFYMHATVSILTKLKGIHGGEGGGAEVSGGLGVLFWAMEYEGMHAIHATLP